jgi:hypothetical protein
MNKQIKEPMDAFYSKGFKEGRRQALEEEFVSLVNILNTNDRFRIGEIEKRIEQIKKEMKG